MLRPVTKHHAEMDLGALLLIMFIIRYTVSLKLVHYSPVLSLKTSSRPLLLLSRSKMPETRRTAGSKRTATLKEEPPKKKHQGEKKQEPVSVDMSDGPWYTMFTKSDEEYNHYMSTEWGFEKRGEVALFEKISLEGAQSGLSWLTILRKRGAYRKAFFNFDPEKVAAMTEEDVKRLVEEKSRDPSSVIVRHSGKINSVINNAKCILELREDAEYSDGRYGALDKLLWSFVGDKPKLNRIMLSNAPSKSAESEAMSKELKKRGFKFVGPTTCYSMMQAVGMVIDHPVDSPEWKASLERLKGRPGGYQDGS